jgi:hypothetical protein
MRMESAVSNKVFRRRAASLAFAAAFGLAASAPMASIVDSGFVSIDIPNNDNGIYMNWVTGVTSTTGTAPTGWDFFAYSRINPNPSLTFFASTVASHNCAVLGTQATGQFATPLLPGDVVGPASGYVIGIVQAPGFYGTGTETVGIQFTNEASGILNYGYAVIRTTAPFGFPATIIRYLYEDTGAPITVQSFVPTLVGATSRKVHGGAGTFDLPLSLVPTNPTTEPRQGPAQMMVFTFDRPLNAATVNVAEGTAAAAAPTFSGNDVVVALTGVSNQQYVTVALTSVASTDGGTGGSASVRVGFLLGDVNQSRVISVADLGLVNAQLAQPVTAANYLKDVNVSGTLTLADKGITNANLTKALPAP